MARTGLAVLMVTTALAVPPAAPATGASADYTLDRFGSVSYSNDDGSAPWASAWLETGEADGPATGLVVVGTDGRAGVLRLSGSGRGATRAVDLSSVSQATMSFRYRRVGLDAGQYLAVEASPDGAAFTEVGRIEGFAGSDATYRTASFDIVGFAADQSAIRLVTSDSTGNADVVYVDDVKVEFAPAPNPDLDAPASVSLGSVEVGAETFVDVVLTNDGGAGDADIRIDSTAISGAGSGMFSHSFAGPVVVEPGDSTSEFDLTDVDVSRLRLDEGPDAGTIWFYRTIKNQQLEKVAPGLRIEDLSAAARLPDRGDLTVAGRSLTKHGAGARSDSLGYFPQARGNPDAINELANSRVDEILNNPLSTIQTGYSRYHGQTVKIVGPDGRGVVYDTAGRFLYFGAFGP